MPTNPRIRSFFITLFFLVLSTGLSAQTDRWLDAESISEFRLVDSTGIRAVAVSPDGNFLVTGGNDGTARIWETFSGKLTRELYSNEDDRIFSVSISPDGESIAAGYYSGIIRLWSTDTGEIIWETPKIYGASTVEELNFSPDGASIAAIVGYDGLVILNALNGSTLLPINSIESTYQHPTSAAFSKDSRFVFVTASIYIYKVEISSGEILQKERGGNPLAAFPDSGLLVNNGSENPSIIRTSDLQQKTEFEAPGHAHASTGTINDIAVAPDESIIATSGPDGTIRLWDTADGAQLNKLVFTGEPEAVVFLPDSRFFAAGFSTGETLIFRVSDGAPIMSYGEKKSNPEKPAAREIDLKGNDSFARYGLKWQQLNETAREAIESGNPADALVYTLNYITQNQPEIRGLGSVMSTSLLFDTYLIASAAAYMLDLHADAVEFFSLAVSPWEKSEYYPDRNNPMLSSYAGWIGFSDRENELRNFTGLSPEESLSGIIELLYPDQAAELLIEFVERGVTFHMPIVRQGKFSNLPFPRKSILNEILKLFKSSNLNDQILSVNLSTAYILLAYADSPWNQIEDEEFKIIDNLYQEISVFDSSSSPDLARKKSRFLLNYGVLLIQRSADSTRYNRIIQQALDTAKISRDGDLIIAVVSVIEQMLRTENDVNWENIFTEDLIAGIISEIKENNQDTHELILMNDLFDELKLFQEQKLMYKVLNIDPEYESSDEDWLSPPFSILDSAFGADEGNDWTWDVRTETSLKNGMEALSQYYSTDPLLTEIDAELISELFEFTDDLIYYDEDFISSSIIINWLLNFIIEHPAFSLLGDYGYFDDLMEMFDNALTAAAFTQDVEMLEKTQQVLSSFGIDSDAMALEQETVSLLFSTYMRSGNLNAAAGLLESFLEPFFSYAASTDSYANDLSGFIDQYLLVLSSLGRNDEVITYSLKNRHSLRPLPPEIWFRLGYSLMAENRYEAAVFAYENAYGLFRSFGGDNIDILGTAINLGTVYFLLEDMEKAWLWYSTAEKFLALKRVSFDSIGSARDELTVYINLASIISVSGQNSINSWAEKYHTSLWTTDQLLKKAEMRLKEYRTALDKELADFSDSALMSNAVNTAFIEELDTAEMTLNFFSSEIRMKEGRDEEALQLHRDSMDFIIELLRKVLPALPEQAREQLLQSYSNFFSKHYRFIHDNYEQIPELAGEFFDTMLFRKGVLLQSVVRMEARIAKSGDPGLIENFATWKTLKEKIALKNIEGDNRNKTSSDSLQSLEAEALALETKIARQSSAFRKEQSIDDATWKDVQAVLGAKEAAIEMIRYESMLDRSGSTSVYYGISVLTTDREPEITFLDNGRNIETEAYEAYREWIAAMEAGEYSLEFFQLMQKYGGPELPVLKQLLNTSFLEPLNQLLPEKVDTVYLSPDGVFSLINLDIISESPRRIQLVTSTRKLIEERTAEEKLVSRPDDAVLIGDPQFSIFPESPVQAGDLSKPLYRGGSLAKLPGTREVKMLGQTLSRAGTDVIIYLGNEASEENVKSLNSSPSVLHLATHGFFFADASPDPLLNGGVYLSGAQDSINFGGFPPGQKEDGLLTGREVSLLDLSDTKLVVLSACETGLGEPRSGEGVYGLLRGFQAAGAGNLIVSRWKVSDEATAVFMQSFYTSWTEGKTVRAAFEQAQQELRNKPDYDSPFYWGAFVLIDAVE